ncbi:MAG TPA: tetratricopeptide repeat protein [Blastocatellia bacterium]|nr:tetratricopeptide repeat protein [Blastocatellia bacterium]
MYPHSLRLPAMSAPLLGFVLSVFSLAQAPPSIQFFMPDGSLPSRELRFNLRTEDGRVDTFFTDSRGRFLITRSQGLTPNAGYIITVESDGRSFDTTTTTFRFYNNFIYHITVFLRPLEAEKAKATGAVDLAELDSQAPQPARAHYESAMEALKAGKVEVAIGSLEKAISIYPRYFRALNDLSVIHMKLNRLDDAARTLEQAISIAPRVYYARLNLAIVRTRQSRFKEAITMLEKLQKENPDLSQIRVRLADALIADNRLDDAESHLRVAIADDSLERDVMGNAHYLLGLLFNRKQRFQDAVKQLESAGKLLPNSPRIHLQLGAALYQLNKLEEAERQLLAAYRIGGAEMGAAQFLLGELYFTQKRYENAMRAFEQYLADVPKAPNAAQVQAVVEKIRTALTQK